MGGSLMEKVLESQRAASAAVGRNYAHRPTSYKSGLALKMDRYTARRGSPSPPPATTADNRDIDRYDSRDDRTRTSGRDDRSEECGRGNGLSASSSSSAYTRPTTTSSNNTSGRGDAERMKMLKDRYGDASGTR